MGKSSLIGLERSDAPFIMNLGILHTWFCFAYLVIGGPHTVYVTTAWLTLECYHPIHYYIFIFSIYVFWENAVGVHGKLVLM